jgi:hypothetical protein
LGRVVWWGVRPFLGFYINLLFYQCVETQCFLRFCGKKKDLSLWKEAMTKIKGMFGKEISMEEIAEKILVPKIFSPGWEGVVV